MLCGGHCLLVGMMKMCSRLKDLDLNPHSRNVSVEFLSDFLHLLH